MTDQFPQRENGPLLFFKAHHRAFAETLVERAGRDDLIDGLLARAFSSFEVNAEMQSEGAPALTCHDGCSTCCTLRVTATAPEVLLIARYIGAGQTAIRGCQPVMLARRIADADRATRGLSEVQRVKRRRQCPFLLHASCIIYPVRPLACRGHACHDKSACLDAALGKIRDIPPIRRLTGLSAA